MEDATLIQRAQDGDEQAVTALYDRYYRAVYTYLALRLNDNDLAADLTGEVFVRMVAHLPRFRLQGRPLLAWLYTIARNLLTDHYRQQARIPTTVLNERLQAGGDSPEHLAEQSLASECLRRALAILKPAHQEVIILRFVEGRSLNEVAALLNKSTGAVKALQHRALAAMRRAIEKAGCYEP